MVLAHLTRHWMARRHYPMASWLACIARSLRVLLFYRAHLKLLALDVYRHHLTQTHDDVFHHLSHRNYLAKGLSLRERVRCVHTHYRFEEATFDADYQRAVYRDGGLTMWEQEAPVGEQRVRFSVALHMAERLNAEGDLTLTLSAGGERLHRLSFSWVDGAFAGLTPDPCAAHPEILPFIARNQGHCAATAAAFQAFEAAFPHNSPSFFCFAALQGCVQALGMTQAVAVKSSAQCAYDPAADKHFANAYDRFWEILGGAALPSRGWQIALPFYVKPLTEMASKHRKRAAVRREHWRLIGESAGAALKRHLLPPATSSQLTARTEPAVSAE